MPKGVRAKRTSDYRKNKDEKNLSSQTKNGNFADLKGGTTKIQNTAVPMGGKG